MSESVKDRFLRELRQSPGKAAVLILGAVIAAFVWGPRLVAGARSSGRPAGAAEATASAGELVDTDGRRSPAAIRAEFIRISEEARALRELARPVEAFPAVNDPFLVPTTPVPLDAAAAPAVTEREDVGDAERLRARDLRLTAIFQFPRGAKAVLGGEVVEVGDETSGFAVMEIEDRSIVVGGRFGTYRIAMHGAEEKE
ncbi:MAG: hypothetical protein ACF8XB_12865 [Planctomycetota bacterium JB042]